MVYDLDLCVAVYLCVFVPVRVCGRILQPEGSDVVYSLPAGLFMIVYMWCILCMFLLLCVGVFYNQRAPMGFIRCLRQANDIVVYDLIKFL